MYAINMYTINLRYHLLFSFSAILANNSSRSKVAANQSVNDLNTAYSNMTFKLDIYDPLETKIDLLDLGKSF